MYVSPLFRRISGLIYTGNLAALRGAALPGGRIPTVFEAGGGRHDVGGGLQSGLCSLYHSTGMCGWQEKPWLFPPDYVASRLSQSRWRITAVCALVAEPAGSSVPSDLPWSSPSSTAQAMASLA